MKNLSSINKYFLLKSLLVLSFYTIGYYFAEMDTAIFSAIYSVLFHISNFALVLFAYNNQLKKVIKYSMIYNFLIINPYTFLPIDYMIQDKSLFTPSYIYLGVNYETYTVILHIVLASFVFISNFYLYVRLVKTKTEQSPAIVKDVPAYYKEFLQSIVEKVRQNSDLQKNISYIKIEEYCQLPFDKAEPNIFITKKNFIYDDNFQVKFVYKKEELDRLEFYYQYQLCYVEEM